MENVFEITTSDNKKEQMQLICDFVWENKKYIIYSQINKKDYYVAKYNEDESLDTNLSDKELAYCNKIFLEVVKNVKNKS